MKNLFFAIVVCICFFLAGCNGKSLQIDPDDTSHIKNPTETHVQHPTDEIPFSELIHADQGTTLTINAFGLGEVTVNQKKFADTLTSGVFTSVYILEDVQLPSHTSYLLVNLGNDFLLHNLETKSLKDTLYLGDVDGDGIQEIVLNQCLGYSGGVGNYLSRVFCVDKEKVTEIFASIDNRGNLNYDTGFTSVFLGNKQLCITNSIVDYQIVLDVSERYNDDFFDNSGKCTRDIHIWCDSFSEFIPEDVNNDGICEIICKQYVSLDGHADGIGYVKSILKYNEGTGQFVIIKAQFFTE